MRRTEKEGEEEGGVVRRTSKENAVSGRRREEEEEEQEERISRSRQIEGDKEEMRQMIKEEVRNKSTVSKRREMRWW